MWVLKRKDKCPPGSYPYEQTEGIIHKFEATSDIDAQAFLVAEFRRANKLPRATQEEAFVDIEEFTCRRIGNMPKFCRDTEGKPYSPPMSTPSRGCGSCGARVR